MSVPIESLSREQLEDIVIERGNQIKTLIAAVKARNAQIETLEGQYEELSGLLMTLRSLIN